MRHVRETVRRPYAAFADREEAGESLAGYLQAEGASVGAVIAVPSGGVPVGRAVAERFAVPLGVVLVRKLAIPSAPEMGFGAVTLDGDVVLNDQVVDTFGISKEQIDQVVEDTLRGLHERAEALLPVRAGVEVKRLDALLVDDGLATGVTMQAALKEMRRRGARTASVAVPVAPKGTLERIEPVADELYCLIAQRPGRFAVASFYAHWYDMTDREVADILRKFEADSKQ